MKRLGLSLVLLCAMAITAPSAPAAETVGCLFKWVDWDWFRDNDINHGWVLARVQFYEAATQSVYEQWIYVNPADKSMYTSFAGVDTSAGYALSVDIHPQWVWDDDFENLWLIWNDGTAWSAPSLWGNLPLWGH